MHLKRRQAHGSVFAPAVVVDVIRRRAVLRMLCRPLGGGTRGVQGDARSPLLLLLRMIGDNGKMLGALARENPCSGEARGLSKLVEGMRARPEESTLGVFMKEVVRLLIGASALLAEKSVASIEATRCGRKLHPGRCC